MKRSGRRVLHAAQLGAEVPHQPAPRAVGDPLAEVVEARRVPARARRRGSACAPSRGRTAPRSARRRSPATRATARQDSTSVTQSKCVSERVSGSRPVGLPPARRYASSVDGSYGVPTASSPTRTAAAAEGPRRGRGRRSGARRSTRGGARGRGPPDGQPLRGSRVAVSMPGSTSAAAPAAAFLSMALRVSGVLINPVPVLDPRRKIEACFRENSPPATWRRATRPAVATRPSAPSCSL